MTVENALRLLSKPARRRILHRIAGTSGPTSVDSLDQYLAGDGGVRETNGSGESRMGQLHHVHLPMLVESDVITYDEASGTVCPGRAFETLHSLLEVVEGELEVGSSD